MIINIMTIIIIIIINNYYNNNNDYYYFATTTCGLWRAISATQSPYKRKGISWEYELAQVSSAYL